MGVSDGAGVMLATVPSDGGGTKREQRWGKQKRSGRLKRDAGQGEGGSPPPPPRSVLQLRHGAGTTPRSSVYQL